MNTGDDAHIKLNSVYELTGAFVWSPDSMRVYFASAKTGWEEGKGGTSIFRLNRSNLELQAIVYNDRRLLIPFSCYNEQTGSSYFWVDRNKLCVMSLDYGSEDYFSNLLLNVSSGNLIVVATPKPGFANTSTPAP